MNEFQKNRLTENMLSLELVASTEVRLSAPLNAQLAETYNGTFDVVLNGSVKPTHKALSLFFTDGIIAFHPNDEKTQESLKEFSMSGGGINLSTASKLMDCPKSMQPEQWEPIQDMLKQVFDVIEKDGLMPMEKLIADTQRSFGYGVARKKRGLGMASHSDVDSPAVVTDIMATLIGQLKALQQPA